MNNDRLIEILEDIKVTFELEATRINNLAGSLGIIIDNFKAKRNDSDWNSLLEKFKE